MFNSTNNSILPDQGKKNDEVKTASLQRTYNELAGFQETTLIRFTTGLINHGISPLLEEAPAPWPPMDQQRRHGANL